LIFKLASLKQIAEQLTERSKMTHQAQPLPFYFSSTFNAGMHVTHEHSHRLGVTSYRVPAAGFHLMQIVDDFGNAVGMCINGIATYLAN
jgi:hypothetical protein